MALIGICFVFLVLAAETVRTAFHRVRQPLLRVALTLGLAVAYYLTFANLLGKVCGGLRVPHAIACLVGIPIAVCVLVRMRRGAVAGMPAWRAKSWRMVAVVVVMLLCAFPQAYHAFTCGIWDECGFAVFGMPAANQLADNVFPPAYNAFPDVPVKYHYGFIMLAGLLRATTNLTGSLAIDFAATSMWLCTFLLAYAMFRSLRFGIALSFWAPCAVLLGGGFVWLLANQVICKGSDTPTHWSLFSAEYWHRAEMLLQQFFYYFTKQPPNNVVAYNIGDFYQQHPNSVGMLMATLTLCIGGYHFTQGDRRTLAVLILVASLGPLCSMPFGIVACALVCFGACWAVMARRMRWYAALGMIVCIGVLINLHGGMFTRGPLYISTSHMLVVRPLSWVQGNVWDWLRWHLASFGVLGIVAPIGWGLTVWRMRQRRMWTRLTLTNLLLVWFTLAGVGAYIIPHILAYRATNDINKFFYVVHWSTALMSVLAVRMLVRRQLWQAVAVGVLVVLSVPDTLLRLHGQVYQGGKRAGLWLSPYTDVRIRELAAWHAKHKGPGRTSYLCYSDRRNMMLSPLLTDGGAVHTVTPTGFEREGAHPYRPEVISKRLEQSRAAERFQPGVFEAAGVAWFLLTDPMDVMWVSPRVKSRLAKLRAERYLVERQPSLFKFVRDTRGMGEEDLDQYWTVAAVLPYGSGSEWLSVTQCVEWVDRIVLPEGREFSWKKGMWVQEHSEATNYFGWTDAGGLPVPADYVGGTNIDLSFFAGGTGEWYVMDLETGAKTVWRMGTAGDIPVPADYDGDGKADAAVWSPGSGVWSIRSSASGDVKTFMFGREGLVPLSVRKSGGAAEPAVWDRERHVVDTVSGRRITVPPGAIPGWVTFL